MPQRAPAHTFTSVLQLRLTPTQHEALRMVAQASGETVSTVLRTAVVAYLDGFTDSAGVTLLEQLEADSASQAVLAKQLAHHFGTDEADSGSA